MKRRMRNTLMIILLIITIINLSSCQLLGVPSVLSPGASPAVTDKPGTSVGSADSPDSSGGASVNPSNDPSADSSAADSSASADSTPGGADSSGLPPESTPPTPDPTPVEKINVTIKSDVVPKGTVLDPRVFLLPNSASKKPYTLSSSDEKIIREVNGQWTAVEVGTADIIATAENGVTGFVTITVIVPVDSLVLSVDKQITLNRGENMQISPVITPVDATDKNIVFTSSNPDVAKVTEDGLVHCQSAGTSVIKGVCGGVSDSFTVTVIVPVTGINITTDSRAYMVGEYGGLTVEVLPRDATDKTYTVSISGVVTDIGEDVFYCEEGGKALITATAANGVAGEITFTVVDPEAYAAEVVRLTNVEREKKGLSPLSETYALTQTAVVRAYEIITKFDHDRPDGSTCFTAFDENGVPYNRAGENIAMGQLTPEEVVKAWMNSPGHKGNILSKDFGKIGVGVAMDANGRLYWSQNFTD